MISLGDQLNVNNRCNGSIDQLPRVTMSLSVTTQRYDKIGRDKNDKIR